MVSRAILNGWPLVPPSRCKTAPVNIVAPSISGTFTVGQTLTLSDGTWDGFPTIAFSRQWLRDGAPIAGATGSTYVLVDADTGHIISATVTATSSLGAASKDAVGALVQGGGGQQQWISASNRTSVPNGTQAVGSNIYGGHVLSSFTGNSAIDEIRLVYSGWGVTAANQGVETDCPNATIVRASGRQAGAPTTHIDANGGAEFTVNPGADVEVSLPMAVPANTQFWIATSNEIPTSGTRLTAYQTRVDLAEYAIVSATKATTTAIHTSNPTPNTGFNGYGPTLVLGLNKGAVVKVLALIVDSLGHGQNEATTGGDAYGNRGYLSRGLFSVGASFARFGFNGATIQNSYGATFAKRRALINKYFTHEWVEVTENSLTLGNAGVKAALQGVWAEGNAAGHKITQVKTGLKATSTDNYATAENQTVQAGDVYTTDPNDTVRVRWAIHFWLDTQVGGPLVSVVDPKSVWSWDSGANIDRWKTGMVNDQVGSTPIHPIDTGHIAAGPVTAAGYLALPA